MAACAYAVVNNLEGKRRNPMSHQKIEYAVEQALSAREQAAACTDDRGRKEWLKAAALWEALARQYEIVLKITEQRNGALLGHHHE